MDKLTTRCRVLTSVVFTFATPVILFAQTIDPKRVAVGDEATVTQDCQATGKPSLVLDTNTLVATEKSGNPKWAFKIPTAVAAKTYDAATFKCPSNPAKDTNVGKLEVTAAPAPAPSDRPVVESVVNVTKATAKKTKQEESDATVDTGKNESGKVVKVELKDALLIKLSNFKAWSDKTPKPSLVLFLDGVELQNVVATAAAPDKGAGEDQGAFRVVVQPQDDKDGVIRKAWVQVLRAAIARQDRRGDDDQRLIDVTLGPVGGPPFATKAKVALDVWPWYGNYVIAFLAVVVILLLWLGISSNLLRDSNGAAKPPFSLAKHQMAIWFVVVVGSYLYIWLITGFLSSISPTALTLIGISGATGLVAVTLDANKRADSKNTRAAQVAERDALNVTLNDPASGLMAKLAAAPAGSPAAVDLTAQVTPKQARFNELNTLLATPAPAPQPTERWDKDILSDENGISFHRFQMAIWTLVLVLVFLRSVSSDLLMPEFDATLLGLMGISAGTYLGFKFPEKPA